MTRDEAINFSIKCLVARRTKLRRLVKDLPYACCSSEVVKKRTADFLIEIQDIDDVISMMEDLK